VTQNTLVSTRRPRKHTFLLALAAFGLLLALAGCASLTVNGTGAAGAGATETPGTPGASSTQGTLAGDVVAGPTCPVERAEDPCPPKAVPNREVRILAANGAVAVTVTTDAKGHFSVALAPGTYTVSVPMKQGLIGMRQMNDVKASIVAGQVTTVKIELDTGIR
jgi:Carboxypeptidase regulatory-like domain